jgi:glycerol-3-phosphate O-acyltransferase
MSIRWLIDTYCSLAASKETLLIVPVNISCDRIYESANLATEMINGEKNDLTMLTALQKLNNIGNDALGDVYVKYLEPVNLHDYLKQNAPVTKELYSAKTFEATAIGLTTHLLQRQY